MSPLSRTERQALVARRRKESVFWGVVHLFGSLHLAMILLFTIALACALATFLESGFNAKVARAYIYKAPWFIFWLALLCINLAAAALTRWPWERRHAGFVVTHLGIITLLVGAMSGQVRGFEASVTLHKGQPPTNRLVLNETVLQVEDVVRGGLYSVPFSVEVRKPRPERPREVRLPGSRGSRLVVTEYANHVDTVRRLVAAPSGAPGIALELRSAIMAQQVPVGLLEGVAERHDLFGLATIGLDVPANRPEPSASVEMPVHESVVAFLKLPDAPVVVPRDGMKPSPAIVRLIGGEGGLEVELSLPGGTSARGGIEPGTVVEARGAEGRVRAVVQEFWPQFAMQSGRPVSLGEELTNPAVRVEIEGNLRAEEARPIPRLLVAVDSESGGLRWRSLRGAVELNRGVARPGESIVTGWADWQAHVVEILPTAVFEERMESVPAESLPPEQARRVPPGIRARLVTADGREGPEEWIVSGSSRLLRAGSEAFQIGFGLMTRRIPFRVSLVGFEVPRDEGSDQPANFISTLRFDDPVSGRSLQRVSRMNHPASYPGGWFAVLTGMNYKFSQASWNPENLDETTLQILYDPGWLLKWVGSLMVSCGIAAMFYLHPNRSTSEPRPGAPEPAAAR